VIWFASTPGVLVVRPDLPAQDVKSLLALSKSAPSLLNMSSAGTGSINHLMGEYFQNVADVKWAHIPYKGSSPALIDLMAGRVDVMMDIVPTAAPYVKSGKLRALAVTTRQRTAAFPDLPTLAESGVADYESWTWNAIFGPANMPQSVAQELSRAVQTVVALPEVQTRLQELSATPVGSTPEALTALVAAETRKWGGIIESIGGLQRD